MGALNRLRAETRLWEEKEGVSAIADKYLNMVGGGLSTNFREYYQNWNDPGPHDGPFWERVLVQD